MKYLKYFSIIALFIIALFVLTNSLNFGIQLYLARTVVIFILFTLIFTAFKKLFYDLKIATKVKNNILLATSTLLILLMLEFAFMFIPRSHGNGQTYAAKIWFKYYWHPINSFGLRDNEPERNKSTIFFIGDSFTAGHGLKKINNRFSNIVDEKLNSIHCVNLGMNGKDSKQEFEIMEDFIEESGIFPESIVLQYCGNDIERAAKNAGLEYKYDTPYSNLNGLQKFIVKGSFIANFIYWLYPHDASLAYIEYLENSFKNEEILNMHKADLDNFILFSRENKIQLSVIIFPFLGDLKLSDELFVEKISIYFETNGIKTVNVSDLVRVNKTTDLFINYNDTHASKEVNRLVANEVLQALQLK